MVFTTLFLALVVGTQTVKVEIEGEPERVLFMVDGVEKAADEAPPWRARVDFGDTLAPHVLDAVAFDDEGNEVGRSTQWVNLPRAEAVVEITLIRSDDGAPTGARLVAASSAGGRPESSILMLDGKSLDAGPEGEYALPPLDLAALHFLSASAVFPNGEWGRRDITIGGGYGGEFTTRLTAVPVVSKRRPDRADMAAVIRVDGSEPRIEAVEKDGHKVFVVADGDLKYLLPTIQPSANYRRHLSKIIPENPDPKLDLTFVVRPVPERSGRGRRATDAFSYTNPMMITPAAPLDWHLTCLDIASHDPSTQRLADAVAVAGVRAAATQCPRVVVLLLAEDSTDVSHFTPGEVRRFLDTLHVPLVVLRWGAIVEHDPWGNVINLGDRRNLRMPMAEVNRVLSGQWVVWIEGHHPLHRIDVQGEAAVVETSPSLPAVEIKPDPMPRETEARQEGGL